MKFLLNMNMPRTLGQLLEAHGHACRHAADIGLGRAPDTAIVEEARQTGEIILTHDLDYGHLLAISGHAKPSVVIFRMASVTAQRLFQRFAEVEALIAEALAQGAIVVVQDEGVRIRSLPLDRGR